MLLEITEETHNKVRWEISTQLVQALIGIGLAVVVSVMLMLIFPNLNFLVWVILIAVVIGGLGIILLLALLKPIWEKGLVERRPEGGVVRRKHLRRTDEHGAHLQPGADHPDALRGGRSIQKKHVATKPGNCAE